MSVNTVCNHNVATIQHGAGIVEAASKMRAEHVGDLIVVEHRAGKLVPIGILTDRDIVVRSLASGKGPETPVSESMTTEIFSVGPEDFVFEAIRLMGDRQVRRVPVVNEDGSLAGIIAMADVALETEDHQEIAEALEEISSGAAFWSKN